MSKKTILVTGFEPFGGETVNASWEAARALEGWRCGEHVAHARMLPCVYDDCVVKFIAAYEALRPAAVILTGQAARRALICIERIGRRGAGPTPDNRGAVHAVDATEIGAEWLQTTAHTSRIARAIRDIGISVRVSTNAGDYVCNHLYYEALKYLNAAPDAAPAVFVHLPATPEQGPRRSSERRLPTADASRALRAAATAMVKGSAWLR